MHPKPLPFHLGLSLACILGWCSPCQGRTFILPHLLERSGLVSSTPFTFDTTLLLTYNASLHGVDTNSAAVQVFLYDTSGLPMQGMASEVCAPCSYQLDSNNRKLSLRLEDLITENGGGFNQQVKLGFGVVTIEGAGADAVNLQVLTAHSHESPLELSVFGFEPQPISAASQRTHVAPHVLETSGRTSSDPYSFDTTFFATYVGGLPGAEGSGGAELQVYLYDSAGAPMVSGTGTEVCNPCTIALGSDARKRSIVVDDLITAAGGFGGLNARHGFVVLNVGGADPANVGLQATVVNAHTGPFDLSVFGFEPQPLSAEAAKRVRTFVLPHVLERSGRTTDTPYTFDTTIYATYTAGLAGVPAGDGAKLELFLYNNNGGLMVGSKGTPVCNPCAFELNAGQRKQSIRVDDLITEAGGFDISVKLGFAVAVVSGEDPAHVNLQGFVVNSHESPLDLSVFGFNPEEVRAPGAARKAYVIPHVLEKEGSSVNTQYTVDTTLYASYAGGLPGGDAGATARLKLYLYDSATSQPLQGALGEVCNPCQFELSAANRKATIQVENLIENSGGFGAMPVRSAFGLAVIEGDAANVNLQGFVVNAHTGPFDLSIFGFEPQPLRAAEIGPMPIQISYTGGRPSITVPTVIGGEYAVEAASSLTGPWAPVFQFLGDGSVKTVPVLPAPPPQFYRAKAK